jgi:two-component system phosphate regulon sensor histidine kinase PhoR
MNRELAFTNLLLSLGIALVAMVAGAALFAPGLLYASWAARFFVVGVLVVAAIPSAVLFLNKRLSDEANAREVFDELSRMDATAFSDEANYTSITLPSDQAWVGILHRLRETLAAQSRRLNDAEHARARAEIRSQKLTSERKQLAEILAGLSDPVVAVDQYDELVLANPCAEQTLQISSKFVERRALDNLVNCEQLVELLRETRRRKAPSSRTAEVTLIDADGHEQSYRVSCRSLTIDAQQDRNAPHGAVAVLHDIGQLKRIQKRNAEFVSSVSHEMKAPLSGIKAYTELLADDDDLDDATREEFLGVISTQADRLQRLVDNLLNLARMEAGVVDVNKEARSLNELMEDALNVIGPSAEAKQIELIRDLSPMYLPVFADRDMILQAVINLLSNAVKYTPHGGKVTLRTRMEDNQALFEVEDTGVGLSPEDSLKVFEKFYRVKKDSQMAQGTGLGLPLAKHIVEDVHGGTLVVDSILGKGSTFRAVLPSAGALVSNKA